MIETPRSAPASVPAAPLATGAHDVDAAIRDMLSFVPIAEAACADLRRRMTAPDRFYHDLAHLATLWTRHRACPCPPDLATADALRRAAAAIAFHDAILDTRRADNERRSAAFWREVAQDRCPPDEIDWVAATIEATADHHAPTPAGAGAIDGLRRRILDLDLTPLGEEPALFERNTRLLRAEHPHLDDIAWEMQRLAFLRKVDAIPAIYASPEIALLFERPARRNIAREIASA